MSNDLDRFIPGGILITDRVHVGENDNTCSRCREPILESEMPLMIWADNGENLLIYCNACMAGET